MRNHDDIKATIAVQGKYHAFRLAEGLDAKGFLYRLFTVYPKFKIPPYRIDLRKVRSFHFLGALRFLTVRLGVEIPDEFVSFVYDRWVSFFLRKPSTKWIFHGWSGYCEKSLVKAKRIGGITIVDRACPHIDFQQKLIAEEKTLLYGKKFHPGQRSLYGKMKREYALADYIIVPSEYSRRSFLACGFAPDRVIAIPLAYEKATKPFSGKKPERFTVLCIGGVFERKGMYYLLRAWRELGLKNAELIIKGVIPREFPDLLNIPDVRYISHYVSDDDLKRFYDESHLFVLPSVDDGFGMVVAEAMTAALPVIVTEGAGIADTIENGKEGFVVPIRDVTALKEKIRYFYEHPQKVREMGDAALKKSEMFTPDAYAQRVIDVYKRISR